MTGSTLRRTAWLVQVAWITGSLRHSDAAVAIALEPQGTVRATLAFPPVFLPLATNVALAVCADTSTVATCVCAVAGAGGASGPPTNTMCIMYGPLSQRMPITSGCASTPANFSLSGTSLAGGGQVQVAVTCSTWDGDTMVAQNTSNSVAVTVDSPSIRFSSIPSLYTLPSAPTSDTGSLAGLEPATAPPVLELQLSSGGEPSGRHPYVAYGVAAANADLFGLDTPTPPLLVCRLAVVIPPPSAGQMVDAVRLAGAVSALVTVEELRAAYLSDTAVSIMFAPVGFIAAPGASFRLRAACTLPDATVIHAESAASSALAYLAGTWIRPEDSAERSLSDAFVRVPGAPVTGLRLGLALLPGNLSNAWAQVATKAATSPSQLFANATVAAVPWRSATLSVQLPGDFLVCSITEAVLVKQGGSPRTPDVSRSPVCSRQFVQASAAANMNSTDGSVTFPAFVPPTLDDACFPVAWRNGTGVNSSGAFWDPATGGLREGVSLELTASCVYRAEHPLILPILSLRLSKLELALVDTSLEPLNATHPDLTTGLFLQPTDLNPLNFDLRFTAALKRADGTVVPGLYAGGQCSLSFCDSQKPPFGGNLLQIDPGFPGSRSGVFYPREAAPADLSSTCVRISDHPLLANTSLDIISLETTTNSVPLGALLTLRIQCTPASGARLGNQLLLLLPVRTLRPAVAWVATTHFYLNHTTTGLPVALAHYGGRYQESLTPLGGRAYAGIVPYAAGEPTFVTSNAVPMVARTLAASIPGVSPTNPVRLVAGLQLQSPATIEVYWLHPSANLTDWSQDSPLAFSNSRYSATKRYLDPNYDGSSIATLAKCNIFIAAADAPVSGPAAFSRVRLLLEGAMGAYVQLRSAAESLLPSGRDAYASFSSGLVLPWMWSGSLAQWQVGSRLVASCSVSSAIQEPAIAPDVLYTALLLPSFDVADEPRVAAFPRGIIINERGVVSAKRSDALSFSFTLMASLRSVDWYPVTSAMADVGASCNLAPEPGGVAIAAGPSMFICPNATAIRLGLPCDENAAFFLHTLSSGWLESGFGTVVVQAAAAFDTAFSVFFNCSLSSALGLDSTMMMYAFVTPLLDLQLSAETASYLDANAAPFTAMYAQQYMSSGAAFHEANRAPVPLGLRRFNATSATVLQAAVAELQASRRYVAPLLFGISHLQLTAAIVMYYMERPDSPSCAYFSRGSFPSWLTPQLLLQACVDDAPTSWVERQAAYRDQPGMPEPQCTLRNSTEADPNGLQWRLHPAAYFLPANSPRYDPGLGIISVAPALLGPLFSTWNLSISCSVGGSSFRLSDATTVLMLPPIPVFTPAPPAIVNLPQRNTESPTAFDNVWGGRGQFDVSYRELIRVYLLKVRVPSGSVQPAPVAVEFAPNMLQCLPRLTVRQRNVTYPTHMPAPMVPLQSAEEASRIFTSEGGSIIMPPQTITPPGSDPWQSSLLEVYVDELGVQRVASVAPAQPFYFMDVSCRLSSILSLADVVTSQLAMTFTVSFPFRFSKVRTAWLPDVTPPSAALPLQLFAAGIQVTKERLEWDAVTYASQPRGSWDYFTLPREPYSITTDGSLVCSMATSVADPAVSALVRPVFDQYAGREAGMLSQFVGSIGAPTGAVISVTADCAGFGMALLPPVPRANITVLRPVVVPIAATSFPALMLPASAGFGLPAGNPGWRWLSAGAPPSVPAVVLWDPATRSILQDASDVTCKAFAAAGGKVTVFSPPMAGYGVGFAASNSSVSVVIPDALLSAGQPSTTATFVSTRSVVPISSLMLAGDWGASGTLTISCSRSAHGDDAEPFSWETRLLRLQLAWIYEPAAEIAHDEPLAASVQVVVSRSVGASWQPLPAFPGLAITCTLAAGGILTTAGPVSLFVPDANFDSGVDGGMGNTSATFQSFRLLGVPETSYNLTVSCVLGEQPLPNVLHATVRVQGCAEGSEPAYGVGNTLVTGCRRCSDGYFSKGGKMQCRLCPAAGARCSEGKITFLPGYYLASTLGALPESSLAAAMLGSGNGSMPMSAGLPYATVFSVTSELQLIASDMVLLSCPVPEACIVHSESSVYACAPSSTGPLCSICVDGFAHTGTINSGCAPCPNTGLAITALVFGSLFLLGVLTYTSLFMQFSQESAARTVWRTLVNYLSSLVAIASIGSGTLYDLPTFRSVLSWSSAIFIPGSGPTMSLSPITCQLHPSWYQRWYAVLLVPVIAAAFCVTLNVAVIAMRHAPWSRCGRRCICGDAGGWAAVREHLAKFLHSRRPLAVVLVVLLMTFPSLCSTAISALDSNPVLVNGVGYLRADMTVRYDSIAHGVAVTVAWVVVALLCLGFPVGLGWWLIRHSDAIRRHDSHFFEAFGFAYANLRTDAALAYCWECIVLLRRGLLVLLPAVLVEPYAQAAAVQLILLAALGLQMMVKPFSHPKLNRIEAVCCFCLLLTPAILQVRGSPPSLNADVAATVVLLLLHGALFSVIGVEYARLRRHELLTGTGWVAKSYRRVDQGFRATCCYAHCKHSCNATKESIGWVVPRGLAHALVGSSTLRSVRRLEAAGFRVSRASAMWTGRMLRRSVAGAAPQLAGGALHCTSPHDSIEVVNPLKAVPVASGNETTSSFQLLEPTASAAAATRGAGASKRAGSFKGSVVARSGVVPLSSLPTARHVLAAPTAPAPVREASTGLIADIGCSSARDIADFGAPSSRAAARFVGLAAPRHQLHDRAHRSSTNPVAFAPLGIVSGAASMNSPLADAALGSGVYAKDAVLSGFSPLHAQENTLTASASGLPTASPRHVSTQALALVRSRVGHAQGHEAVQPMHRSRVPVQDADRTASPRSGAESAGVDLGPATAALPPLLPTSPPLTEKNSASVEATAAFQIPSTLHA